jgi:hypothetical protein
VQAHTTLKARSISELAERLDRSREVSGSLERR